MGRTRGQGRMPGGMYVRAVEADGRHFELRYSKCGKKCSVCVPGGQHYVESSPGHGPYWYEVYYTAGRRRQRYVGKELITKTTRDEREASVK